MNPQELIAHFGTQAAAARALGLTWAAIYLWQKRGSIPYLRQLQIEQVTAGALKAAHPETA